MRLKKKDYSQVGFCAVCGMEIFYLPEDDYFPGQWSHEEEELDGLHQAVFDSYFRQKTGVNKGVLQNNPILVPR